MTGWFCLLLVLLSIRHSKAIILCDEGCVDSGAAANLGICMKDSSEKVPLLLMGLFPCNVPDFRGRGMTVAGQMAARTVRLDKDILQDYSLQLSFSNSMVHNLTII